MFKKECEFKKKASLSRNNIIPGQQQRRRGEEGHMGRVGGEGWDELGD